MTILASRTSPQSSARRVALLVAAAVTALTLAGPAFAQNETPQQLLEDFVHYLKVAKPELAVGYGQRLLESGVTDAELAEIVDESDRRVTRFDSAIGRALLNPQLEPIAAEVARRVEQGRRDLARDGQRIDEAIEMLIGTQRQRLLAAGRLRAAGEYAVPGLLKRITDGHDDKLKLACQNMLREIGLPAVAPLSAALLEIDPRSQQTVCDTLGDIGYSHAGPFLRDLRLASTDGPVRESAERAFSKLQVFENDLSRLYGVLAHQYYNAESALTPYPADPTNNAWSYDAFVGLVPTPVPTSIFHEVLAMRFSAKALAFDSMNRQSLALFVAANLKRENELGGDESDPVYGESAYTPGFFATVFGTQVCLDVLGLAIDTTDTPLVRDAIASLAQTTGGSNLFSQGDGRQPLLEALAYPDRRVQYDAALTLARALPTTGFEGDYRVVPTLASAVRTGAQSFAMVVADDPENRRQAVTALEKMGFTIAGAEASVAALGGAVADAPGIDLVLVRLNSADATRQAVNEIHGMTKTGAAPILALVGAVDVPEIKREFQSDTRVHVARPGIGDEAFAATVEALLRRASGGRMTEAEAEAYAFESLGALEDIAISCSPAYQIVDAESSLLDALDARTGRARLLVAGILARIDTERAQRSLMDAALAASDGERVDLLDAAADSVKRFGNRAEQHHIRALLDLIANNGGSTAEAAARVHGAMNLPSTDAVLLIQPSEG